MATDKTTEEFLELIEQNKKLIYKVSHMYCDKQAEKEDLFQEIIANLWKAYPHFRRESKVSTWTYRIALNTAISWMREYSRKDKHIEYLNVLPQLKDDHVMDEIYEQLYTAIGNLTKLEKALILLQLDGYSNKEISEITGLSNTNVSTRISRIKQKLRDTLSGN